MSITVPALTSFVGQTIGVLASEGALRITRKNLAPERPIGSLRFGGKKADVLLDLSLN
jgi:hypothetical protein